MKKWILALVLLGAGFFNATAQSNSKYAKNYKVCRADDGAYVVCSDDRGENLPIGTRISSYAATRPLAVPAIPVTAPRPISPSVSYPNEKVGYRWDRAQKVKVTYEDVDGTIIEEPRAPAYGRPSPQYDGPDRNAARNLNYGSGQYVPPSDGAIR